MAKQKGNKTFGAHVPVIVISPESEYNGQTGVTVNGNKDKEGRYLVAFDGEHAGSELIFCDHLDTTEDLQPDQFAGQAIDPALPREQPDPELQEEVKEYVIMEASLKDDYCNFSFKITDGVGAGNICKVVDTKHIVMADLKKAFERFFVHLAVIDDVYRHSDIEIDDIDKFHNHTLTNLYHVTSFKITGNEEGETIVLKGSKYLSNGDRMEITSPKTALDNLSSYQWYNELRAAADEARREVALYKEGKYTVDEEDEEEDEDQPKSKKKGGKSKQLTIGDAIDEAIRDLNESGDDDFADDDDFEDDQETDDVDSDFEAAKV